MKLLIVDDEPITRDSLVALIPFKSLGIREVLTASNGRSAYQMATKSRPDIVLCDVRMPKMDGLELSRRLCEDFPEIKIIFISGYADKEYLKTAIALQAVGYAEKPIDIEEIAQLLKKAMRQIEKDRAHRAESERLMDARREVGALARQQILFELFCAPTDPEAIRRRFGASFFDWPDRGVYAAACLKVLWPDPRNTQSIEEGARALMALAAQSFESGGFGADGICGMLSPTQLGMAFRLIGGDMAPLRALLSALAQKVQDARPSLSFNIGLSAPASNLDELPKRYADARGIAQWAEFSEKGRFLACETGHAPLPRSDAPDALESALTRRAPAEARRLVLELTRGICAMDYADPRAVRHLYEQLLSVCLDRQAAHAEDAYVRMGLLGAFSGLRTLSELMRFLLSRIDALFPEIQIPGNIHPKIAQAMALIQANLGNPSLSIPFMARRLDLTENYLCALYKKETGTTINRAIIDARIEYARRLLVRDYKLYEVAAQAGFADPNYFSAVFKKYEGVSPTRYRREHGAQFPWGYK